MLWTYSGVGKCTFLHKHIQAILLAKIHTNDIAGKIQSTIRLDTGLFLRMQLRSEADKNIEQHRMRNFQQGVTQI